MPRIHVVKKAQARYEMKTVTNPDGSPKQTPVMRNGVQRTTKKGKPIFRTVTVEDKSKPKPNRKCDKCGKEIKVGDPYKWTEIKMTYGGMKKVRCMDCPSWKQSELTMSKMSGVYAAQEMVEDTDVLSVEDLESLRDDAVSQIEEVAQEYEDSATNIEEGFGHSTSMSEELNEKAESLRSWADEIQSVDFEEPPDCDVCSGVGTVECEQCEGNGSVQSEDGGELVDCEACSASGQIHCEDCDGEGKPGESTEQYTEFITEQKDLLAEAVANCPI
jgi:hypothetical protein